METKSFLDYKYLLRRTDECRNEIFVSLNSSLLNITLCNKWRFMSTTTSTPNTTQVKAQCALWFHETKLPMCALRAFRRSYRRNLTDEAIVSKVLTNWLGFLFFQK